MIGHKDTWNLDGVSMNKTKKKYYERVLSIKRYKDKDIENLCYNYIKTLNWCTKYYFDECPDWIYYYDYHYSPLPSEISLFLHQKPLQHFHYDKDEKPLHPLVQLLIIIPPSNKNIIYKDFQEVYKIPYYKKKLKHTLIMLARDTR